MPNRCRELPRTVPGHPKPTLNRSRDPLRTPCGAQGRSESIPRASWKPLGAPQRAPGLLGESPKVARDARKSARERPATLRGRQNRGKIAPGDTKSEFSGTALLRIAVIANFHRFFVISRFFVKSRSRLSKVPRLSAKSRVRLFALQVAPLARSCLKKQRKSIPKSTENR